MLLTIVIIGSLGLFGGRLAALVSMMTEPISTPLQGFVEWMAETPSFVPACPSFNPRWPSSISEGLSLIPILLCAIQRLSRSLFVALVTALLTSVVVDFLILLTWRPLLRPVIQVGLRAYPQIRRASKEVGRGVLFASLSAVLAFLVVLFNLGRDQEKLDAPCPLAAAADADAEERRSETEDNSPCCRTTGCCESGSCIVVHGLRHRAPCRSLSSSSTSSVTASTSPQMTPFSSRSSLADEEESATIEDPTQDSSSWEYCLEQSSESWGSDESLAIGGAEKPGLDAGCSEEEGMYKGET